MKKLMRTRHRHGIHATEEQLNAIVDLSRATRMDESWFGEIREAVAGDGKKVHVVWDNDERIWLSLKFAVKLLDEGTGFERDYLEKSGVHAYHGLLVKCGLMEPYNGKCSWRARFASKIRHKLSVMRLGIMSERNDMNFPIRKFGDVYYIDVCGSCDWVRSYCLWFARRNEMKIPYEVVATCDGGKTFRRVVHNGECCVSYGTCVRDAPWLTPRDIVEKTITTRKEPRNEKQERR